ncbi:MAG: hypothetical protein H0U27_13260, partial [Nitrosopumilus sp.]|nr:hypothetical protein [Nitrosopumilus sp.]
CIALLNTNVNMLDVLHIEVDIAHRNRHIGRTLLGKVQEEATKLGAKTFSFIYPLDQPETVAIEKILDANQWKGSRKFLIRALFDPSTFKFNAPIMHLQYEYPPGYREFLWKDLKESQREDLLHRERQGHFSRAISPFREEEIMEPLNSLGLEYEGRVVGWLINHHIDPDIIRYTSFYIEPSLKYKGLAMKLMSDSLILHGDLMFHKHGLTEVPYLQVHPSYINFVERRLVPLAEKVTRLQQRWHTL